MSDRRYFVYRVYDADDNLLYVGCTCHPKQRWSAHRSERPEVYSRAHHFKVQGPYTREVGLTIERRAAETEHPLYGWTPLKQGHIQRRRAWVNARTRELMKLGWSFWPAYDAAGAQAVGQFGPEVTYYNPWHPQGVAA